MNPCDPGPGQGFLGLGRGKTRRRAKSKKRTFTFPYRGSVSGFAEMVVRGRRFELHEDGHVEVPGGDLPISTLREFVRRTRGFRAKKEKKA